MFVNIHSVLLNGLIRSHGSRLIFVPCLSKTPKPVLLLPFRTNRVVAFLRGPCALKPYSAGHSVVETMARVRKNSGLSARSWSTWNEFELNEFLFVNYAEKLFIRACRYLEDKCCRFEAIKFHVNCAWSKTLRRYFQLEVRRFWSSSGNGK